MEWRSLLERNNPRKTKEDVISPLSVGNGNFAYTVDITGLQTLYNESINQHCPLCTMSNWGWHSKPYQGRYPSFDEVEMTEYDFHGRKVSYAVEAKSGNEEIYHWRRQNPHRFNLGRLGFVYQEKEICLNELTDTEQTLELGAGVITSSFHLDKMYCKSKLACDPKTDTLGIQLCSEAIKHNGLELILAFPYGSPDISASDWENIDLHTTKLMKQDKNSFVLHRKLDQEEYYVSFYANCEIELRNKNQHEFIITPKNNEISFTLNYSQTFNELQTTCEDVFLNSRKSFDEFWKQIGMIDLHKSKDSRARELERRVVLSQYLTRIQCTGNLPPQETGLTCNSWYGKFHLEMHPWHTMYLPLYQQGELLEKSLEWYLHILPKAKENAARNGFKGARWPKMVAEEGIDSPSVIATLLIWQQPHIIYMLELIYREKLQKGDDTDTFLRKYWDIVKETADFMADYPVWNREKNCFDLCGPLIPAQEEFEPVSTINPTFELAYFRFGLNVATDWAKRVGAPYDKWSNVAEHMAPLPEKDNLYLSHEACPDTYQAFNKDHPSMLLAYGFLPPHVSEKSKKPYVSEEIVRQTLKQVLECWNYESMWGWDFALMAMTATRLKMPELAIDILLKSTPKNTYVMSGNNYQSTRNDLPLYLPGNGSLLLAMALMTAGYEGCTDELPGFPKDGNWIVEYKNINRLPF